MKGAVFSGTVNVSTQKHTNQFFFFLFFFPFPQTLLHLFSYAKADGYTKWRNPAWGDHIFQISRLLCKEWAQGNADSKAYIFFFPLKTVFLLVLRRITSHTQDLATQLPGLEPAGIDLLQVYIHFIMLEWQATCLFFFFFSINCNTLLAPVVYCKLVLFLSAYACVFTSQKMLRMDPKERITVNDALEHYYFGDLVSVP